MRFLSVWVLIFQVSAVPAQADNAAVYKWVDAKGVTHYSDTEPGQGGQHEQVVLPEPNLLTSETLADFPAELATSSSPAPKRRAVLLDNRNGGYDAVEEVSAEADSEGYSHPVYFPLHCDAKGRCFKPGHHGFKPPRRPHEYHRPVHNPTARKPIGEPIQKKIHIRGKGFDVSRNQRVCLGNCKPLRCLYDDQC